jgi:hypothetical protein
MIQNNDSIWMLIFAFTSAMLFTFILNILITGIRYGFKNIKFKDGKTSEFIFINILCIYFLIESIIHLYDQFY